MIKKPIKNFEGVYEITSTGQVWSIERLDSGKKPCGGRFLNFLNDGSRYRKVMLSLDDKNYKFYVHRLVAETFIPNPGKLPYINHKDGNLLNNNVDNLEWVDYQKNSIVSSRTFLQMDLNGNLLNEWHSYNDIRKKLGIAGANVTKACKGLRKSAGGFLWKYKG